MGDSEDHDGVRIGTASDNPLVLVAEPFNPFRIPAPFRNPVRAMARRSISPDASSAIRKRASSAHSSQSLRWDANPIRRTT